jgi:hypothetical protein
LSASGHDPFARLRDAMTRPSGQPVEDLADLIPDRWTLPKAADVTS